MTPQAKPGPGGARERSLFDSITILILIVILIALALMRFRYAHASDRAHDWVPFNFFAGGDPPEWL